MNAENYQAKLTKAIAAYIQQNGFIGYFYPGQFYDFTQSTTEFRDINGTNTYRWMLSLEDECKALDGVTFSKLSPAKEGTRANAETFATLFNLARMWHKEASTSPLAVYIAKGTHTDRRIALSEMSRYFGGMANLRYLVSETSILPEEFPPLIRSHYKDAVSRLVNNNLTQLSALHPDNA